MDVILSTGMMKAEIVYMYHASRTGASLRRTECLFLLLVAKYYKLLI